MRRTAATGSGRLRSAAVLDSRADMSDLAAMEPDRPLGLLRRRATRLGLRHEETQGKRSHLKLRHGAGATVIPMHRGDMPGGTYRAILRQPGLTEADLED